eukprot:TRINITY_DN835_c1_g1_i1.p1 TRINITY_DN835_c1_g1~~TRINITY_DN835_c1_g1_i1.p1  ORF type:complete len:446 (+),score=135.89 TRINITY_DN835_c1_g1_i1:168-1505(+)
MSSSRRRVKVGAGGEGGGEKAAEGGDYNPGEKKSSKQRRVLEAFDVAPMLVMSDIADKLKLLDYEDKYCRPNKMKPVSNIYFAVPVANSSEQFGMFAGLTHWLAGLVGQKFAAPDQFDDPNATATTLLMELKKIKGVSIDFAPQRITSGHGDAVCHILNTLCDKALAAKGFKFSAPIHDSDGGAAPVEDIEVSDEEDEMEDRIDTEMIEDEAIEDDGDDDDDYEYGTSAGGSYAQTSKQASAGETPKRKGIMHSKIDPATWKLELERVGPLLKVKVQSDVREWRSRVDQLTKFLDTMETEFPANKAQLDKIAGEVRQVLDKIESREKYYNNQLEHLVSEYRIAQEKLLSINDKYKSANELVTTETNELANITDDLDAVKAQMDDRGTSMTDTSPLIKIKAALSNIKKEIQEMDVRIGMVQQSVLHTRLRNKTTKVDNIQRGIEAL